MSENVVRLPSADFVLPEERVREFIELARHQIDALIPNEIWPDDVWPVGEHFITKGQNRDSRILAFYNSDAKLSNRQEVTGDPLHPAMREFAKAYLRYTHSTSRVTFENTQKRLDAIRFIEAAFRRHGLKPRIEDLSVIVLNEAVGLAKAGVGPGRHYQFAIYIQQIYRFCVDRKFLNGPFQWKHGVRKPKDRTEEMGEEAKEWRNKKLPSPEAFHALAHVYLKAETFVDRLYSSICVICISIPIRAHEVLQLRLDCEVHEQVKDPETGEMVEAYGIRVWPGKGNPPQVKWVPTQMVTVVKEAVGRLREMCSDARSVAAWYERHPQVLWLPEQLRDLQAVGKIPVNSVRELIATPSRKGMLVWLREKNIHYNDDQVAVEALKSLLLPLMPTEFPHFNGEKDQLYSETLILLFYNQSHPGRATYHSILTPPTVQGFEHWLSGHDGGRKPSVFKVWGFAERDGSDIEITTHAFRHWLNTVAQFRGMSDIDIAKWSGRDISQNKSYNHVTTEEILSQIKQALDDGNAIGPMFEASKKQGINQPVDRREFIDAQIGAALVTDSGICVHDYSLLPCQSYGDCVGCSENVFIKGDQKHLERVTKRLALAEKQLSQAEAAMREPIHTADKWVATHRRNIERMRQMLAIHADSSIPDGTIVNLPAAVHDNEVAMAIRDRQEKLGPDFDVAVPEDDDDMQDALSTMWDE